MKELRCPNCGAKIVCIIERPDLYFYIDNDELVKRDKTTDTITNKIMFVCSYDSTHLIEEFNLTSPGWKCKFLEKIKDILMEEN